MTREGALSRWQHMTEAAVQRWDRLTTDDLGSVRGNAERMVELLQARYGLARHDALAELAAWRQSLAALGAAASRPTT
jgi:hypothetical protein